MSDCTVTIFGRRLADLPVADAKALRSHIADLDDCPDCAAVKQRREMFSTWANTEKGSK